MAQSVGGGGGTGGDSTAASYSGGRQGGVAVSVSVAVGGSGGTGGTGGAVTVWNDGLVATRGQDAYGVFAQSVGGGGGSGGAGDASSVGEQGKGQLRRLDRRGRDRRHRRPRRHRRCDQHRRGDDGRRRGRWRVCPKRRRGRWRRRGRGRHGRRRRCSALPSVSAGAAARAATATRPRSTNGGSIVTRGTDAIGLSVQSIGGGGGKGGKGGATAGGSADSLECEGLVRHPGRRSGPQSGRSPISATASCGSGRSAQEIQATYDELNGIFSQPQAGDRGERHRQADERLGVGRRQRRGRGRRRRGQCDQHRGDRDLWGPIGRHLCAERRRRRRQRRCRNVRPAAPPTTRRSRPRSGWAARVAPAAAAVS